MCSSQVVMLDFRARAVESTCAQATRQVAARAGLTFARAPLGLALGVRLPSLLGPALLARVVLFLFQQGQLRLLPAQAAWWRCAVAMRPTPLEARLLSVLARPPRALLVVPCASALARAAVAPVVTWTFRVARVQLGPPAVL
jgi:hypothetical protein